MEAKASAWPVRMSARKMRLVADEVRGYVFPEAVDILRYMPQKGARIILKTLEGAYANARAMNPEINPAELYIKKIFVDGTTSWKRYMPRARGRADRILRRTCRLTVVLSDE
ncbi:MAG: 50S ribosomal protein L22 [Leptospiraceae bacterium]|nr:50S ribosomal protein L22 [Leptospiraceae bacterium]MDW8306077.1 50S ribosomal protein L22 [Leptospiraceae bacterium]